MNRACGGDRSSQSWFSGAERLQLPNEIDEQLQSSRHLTPARMDLFAGATRSGADMTREYHGRPPADFIAPGEHDSFAFALDPSGRLAWRSNDVSSDHVVAILTERVAETTAMTHIAIQEVLDGKPVTWMEKVTDEQYLSASN